MPQVISRRLALKAAGISIALPLLESFGGTVGSRPDRIVFICNTLGFLPTSLFPKQTGSSYQGTPYLDLLSQHRDDFTLFSGLSHPDQNGKEPHDTEMTWLSAAPNPGLGGFKNSISIDQFTAERVGFATRFPSISLSTNTPESQSYDGNGVMLPAWHRPSQVFSRLFLVGSAREVRRQRQQLAQGRSILDAVIDQSQSLRGRSSLHDQHQLDEYLTALREAELKLASSEAWLDKPKPQVDEKPPQDLPDPAELIGRTQAMLKLIPLVLRTDSSRVITLMIQDHGVVPNIPGVSSEYHNLSHHGQDPHKIEQLGIIETEILQCFSEFLDDMKSISENGKRLLDSTSVLMGSNLGNANSHDPKNLPVFVAGGGMQHGRYLAMAGQGNRPLCNLFVGLLHRMGLEVDKFASSDGTLEL